MPTGLPKSAARWSMSSPTSGRPRHSPRTRGSALAAVNATQSISPIADAIQVIGDDHKVVDGPGARQLLRPGGSIAFENVDFSYPGGREVFRGFNLRIERGRRVGLVGPSGA